MDFSPHLPKLSKILSAFGWKSFGWVWKLHFVWLFTQLKKFWLLLKNREMQSEKKTRKMLEVFHHFRNLSEVFLSVWLEKFRVVFWSEHFFTGRNFRFRSFSAIRRETFKFSKRFSTRMSQLLTTCPGEHFENFYDKPFFFFITFRSWSKIFWTVRGKIFVWAKKFRPLA